MRNNHCQGIFVQNDPFIMNPKALLLRHLRASAFQWEGSKGEGFVPNREGFTRGFDIRPFNPCGRHYAGVDCS
jgi:hypothetical protein